MSSSTSAGFEPDSLILKILSLNLDRYLAFEIVWYFYCITAKFWWKRIWIAFSLTAIGQTYEASGGPIASALSRPGANKHFYSERNSLSAPKCNNPCLFSSVIVGLQKLSLYSWKLKYQTCTVSFEKEFLIHYEFA